jgi:hypothetical protein
MLMPRKPCCQFANSNHLIRVLVRFEIAGQSICDHEIGN